MAIKRSAAAAPTAGNIARVAVAVILSVVLPPPGPLHSQPLRSVGPIPTRHQLDRLDRELFLFVHFGPNTFTGNEWGKGSEPESLFNPTAFDAGQWCRVATAAGAEGIVITAKHHDGFCLWPSRYSTHTVRESPWRGGNGDVLRDLSDSCRAAGLKFGVYLSPWDRNHPSYGTPEYNDIFVNTMKEIFEAYGPIYELWWDGANGEGPNGRRQDYDFRRFENTIREISPSTVIFSDIGPDLRWVGNENGIAGETNWNLLDTAGFGRGTTGPPPDTLNRGNENGALWIPAECDVSIRPGWFYHAGEDSLVKSPRELIRIYLQSVGRGSTLLLNVPPGPDGLISAVDSASLAGFRMLRDGFYGPDLASGVDARSVETRDALRAASVADSNLRTYWAARDGAESPAVELGFTSPIAEFNTIVLREPLEHGQRVKSFSVEALTLDGWRLLTRGTTIGRKRILQFPEVMALKLRLSISGSKGAPAITSIEIYNAPDYLNDK